MLRHSVHALIALPNHAALMSQLRNSSSVGSQFHEVYSGLDSDVAEQPFFIVADVDAGATRMTPSDT